MTSISNIFEIERGGTGIQKGGTGIEKGGTGIEKGGTGIEKGGTGIQKGGTGRRSFGKLRIAALGLVFGAFVSSSALAAPTGTWEDWGDLGGTVQFGVKADTLTASWSTFNSNGDPILLLGTGQLSKGVVNMRLFKVESGFHGNREPMPFLQAWGHATLDFDGCGNAYGSVSILKAEGAGTGDKAEGAGTGDKAEGAGTGDKAEGAGTGDKLAFFGDVVLVGPGDKAGGCQ